MRVFVVEPPAPVVTWEDAEVHLKLDGDTTQKDEVEGFVAAATQHIDGPEGWLQRCIGVQTLEVRFEAATCGNSIRLPCPPIIDLVAVQYLDRDNVLCPADLADLEVMGRDVVSLGQSWPWAGASARREACRIRYRAGHEELPAPVRAAILLMTGDLYRNRDTVSARDVTSIPMSTTVANLLGPYQVYA